jgi:hypothetical protein
MGDVGYLERELAVWLVLCPSYFQRMRRIEPFCSRFSFAVLASITLFLQGCVSLQIAAKNGRPRLIGFAYAKSVGGRKSQVYQIDAPGLSLRIGSDAPGLSFGWHETRLFYPATSGDTNSPIQPIAIHTKCVGVDLAPVGIMVGYENTFAIPLPDKRTHVIQLIAYSENDPTNTVVERKEMK